MACAFIDDGYTEDGVIPECPGLWPEIRFSYRPLTAADFADYAQAAEKLNTAALKKLTSERIASKLVTWSIADSRGADVPITAENVARLKPAVFSALFDRIASQPPETWGKNSPPGCG